MSFAYRAILLLLFFLVYIIGLIGNGLLIFIVFRQKNLRTVPNLLVVSLALGDFLFVLFCVPFGAVAYSLEYYPFSAFYCRFENFIINLSLGVSVFSLLALSADRYKIIVKPFSSHANDPSIKLKLIVIIIWFLSTLLALPETIYSGLITETLNHSTNASVQLTYCWSPNTNQLLMNHSFMITRQLLRLIIYYIMPLIFVSIFYILIARHLLQTKTGILSPIVFQQQKQPIKNRRIQSSSLTMNLSQRTSRPSKNFFYNHFIRKSHPQEHHQQQQQSNELHDNFMNNPIGLRTLESEDLLSTHDESSHNNNNIRPSRDLLYGNTMMTTTNSVIIHTLHQDFKTKKQLRARHKVAKTVLFLCIVFFICWLPKQIHDLYWFVGVLVYSARWNHFWQFNKSLALILSYIYSCINPFALYFLSSTFRHFYKRYLFFWTNKKCCCCCCTQSIIQRGGGGRGRTNELTTSSDYRRRSSTNNATSICCDLNRIKTLNSKQQSPLRMHQYMRSETTLTGSAPHLNGIPNQTTVMSAC